MSNQLFADSNRLLSAKILIVDDEEAHIRVLEWALKRANFPNFRSISDSTRAHEEFTRYEPDLVLLDLNMPNIDGLTLLQQFRESLPSDTFLPMLVLTGENTEETRARAFAAGAQDFLTKPLDFTEVMLRIRNLLQTRFLYQQTKELQQQLEALKRSTQSNGDNAPDQSEQGKKG